MKKYQYLLSFILLLAILFGAMACKTTPTTDVDEVVGPVDVESGEQDSETTGEVDLPAEADGKSERGFIEPPFFESRVAAGELPPIDERLPEEVFVVGPGVLMLEEFEDWEDGQYGGDINIAPTFGTGFLNIAGGAPILRSPSQTTAASRPNIVSDFSYSSDYTTFTFTIRKGLRWSDGAPVTTEDVRFTFEDLYEDPDVQRGTPTQLYAQGNSQFGRAELTIVDDYTFVLTFSKPYGAFVADLNSWIPYYDIIFKPSHFLKQFHAKYADADELAALLEEANETSWVNLLNQKDVVHWDVGEQRALGFPVLNAWVLTEVTEDRRIFERNPYFWHVDANGRQLPYIDRVVNNMSIDGEAEANALLAGQITVATGGQTALNRMPLYIANAESVGLRLFTTGSFNYPILLFLNHDYEYDVEDSAWQALITDQRFGEAIAAAMDPDEINNSVFFGEFGEPFGNNTGRDLAKANELLDALGMVDRGSDGYRLDPFGNPFIFRISFSTGAADFVPVAELLKEQIEEAGIRVELENMDGALWDQRKAGNEIMASIAWNDGTAWQYGISEDYLPNHKGPWSPMTWLYYTTNGESGRKPPQYIQDFYDMHTSRKEYPPQSPEGEAIFEDMLTWMFDNYVFIPTVGLRVHPGLANTNLRNVPNDGSPFDLDVYINAEGYWFASE